MRFQKRIIPFLLLATVLTAPAAFAAGRFTSGTANVTDGNVRQSSITDPPHYHGGLRVDFTEVGVGGYALATYNVSADCTATYGCLNKSGNLPAAASKRTMVGPVTATVTITADETGRVVGAIAMPPTGPGDFTCKSGDAPELIEVSYTNVWIREPAHGAELHIDGTFSLTIIPTK
jgi:hypothetical protein